MTVCNCSGGYCVHISQKQVRPTSSRTIKIILRYLCGLWFRIPNPMFKKGKVTCDLQTKMALVNFHGSTYKVKLNPLVSIADNGF